MKEEVEALVEPTNDDGEEKTEKDEEQGSKDQPNAD